VTGDTPLHVAVLNGPNLNLLGEREPGIYGRTTLLEINEHLAGVAAGLGLKLSCTQSNSEGALIDTIHGWRAGGVRGALVNAGAFTHTSLAMRDALAGVAVPFIEVHLTNIYAREAERRHSMLASAALGVICGFGAHSYELALRALAHQMMAQP